ncbi:MAG: O-antigen ligase family protein [Planctomycetaceae bacterium]
MSVRKRHKSIIKQGESQPVASPLEQFTLGLIGFGWMMRWLTITEGATTGETLLVCLVWLIAGSLVCWLEYRATATSSEGGDAAKDATRFSIDLLKGGLILIVLGHLLGFGWLWLQGGQLRFALNLCWEWIGLLATFLALRWLIRQRGQLKEFYLLLLASAIPFACVGLWQHYVWYENASQEYLQHKTVYLELNALDPAQWSSQQQQQYLAVQDYFQQQGVPLETTAIESWENRLLASKEPLGFFALTNSFAALLLFLIGVWLAAGLRDHQKKIELKQGLSFKSICWWGTVLLLVYVLILTKSRTAWLALLFTLGLFALTRWSRRWWYASTGVIVGTGLLIAIAMMTGALDSEVLSEAPRSVQYRWIYWKTTLQMLSHSPLVGVGPGNFRTNYLQYKPAGASEEIADPHQFLLDLWANGGLLALLGLVMIALYLFRSYRRAHDAQSLKAAESLGAFLQTPVAESNFEFSSLFIGGLSAFICMGLIHRLNYAKFEWVLFFSAMGVLLVAFFLKKYGQAFLEQLNRRLPQLSEWILLLLLVHFSASGGIEMPALVQILLLLLALVPGTMKSWNLRINTRNLYLAGCFSGSCCRLCSTDSVASRAAIIPIPGAG